MAPFSIQSINSRYIFQKISVPSYCLPSLGVAFLSFEITPYTLADIAYCRWLESGIWKYNSGIFWCWPSVIISSQVRKIWQYHKQLPNYNYWWNGIEDLIAIYNIQLSQKQIRSISKGTFKQKVRRAIALFALGDLNKECQKTTTTWNHETSELRV